MTVSVELPPRLQRWVSEEAKRRSAAGPEPVSEADVVCDALKEAADRADRVNSLIAETVTENAELYRRLAQ